MHCTMNSKNTSKVRLLKNSQIKLNNVAKYAVISLLSSNIDRFIWKLTAVFYYN
jgi:hypothetical protein